MTSRLISVVPHKEKMTGYYNIIGERWESTAMGMAKDQRRTHY
jgi:hypothetical protein